MMADKPSGYPSAYIAQRDDIAHVALWDHLFADHEDLADSLDAHMATDEECDIAHRNAHGPTVHGVVTRSMQDQALRLALKLAEQAGEELDYFLAHEGLWPVKEEQR